MKRKFYAVHKGRSTGIFEEWNEVIPHIQGFSGAKYKKFDNIDDAKYFLEHGKIPIKKDANVKVNFDDINIFTDGAFSSKTKKAGIGIYFGYPYSVYSISKKLPDNSTNQYAELFAIAKAIMILKEDISKQFNTNNSHTIIVDIWTDSKYSKDCIYTWYPKWVKNGWKTTGGDDVKYQEFISYIVQEIESAPYKIRIRHIKEVGLKSHQSEPDDPIVKMIWKGNKQADKLASSCTIVDDEEDVSISEDDISEE